MASNNVPLATPLIFTGKKLQNLGYEEERSVESILSLGSNGDS